MMLKKTDLKFKVKNTFKKQSTLQYQTKTKVFNFSCRKLHFNIC